MIEVENLTKRFGKVLAVDGLSFRAEPGKVTGFLGPNGAGKTTTLRALVALLHPTSGTATVLGRPYAELEDPGRHVGAILEVNAFHPGRTGRNHLRTLAIASGIDESRVDVVLPLVDLSAAANRKVKGYSLGMKQRLALAGALLGEPEVLILDEPANGLDPQGIRWLRDLLKSLADEGRTLLVSSHVLSEMALLADDVVIIAKGRSIMQAPIETILASGGRGTRVRTPQRDALAAALEREGMEFTPLEDNALVTNVEAPRIGELAAREGIVLHELAAVAESLEDVFLQLTKGESTPS